MSKIPFNVHLAKQIQAGILAGKIITREGREAFITCWGTDNTKRRLQAFVRMSDTDMAELSYSQEGVLTDKTYESIWDLMLEIHDSASNVDNCHSNSIKNITINLKNKGSFKAFDKVLVRNSPNQVWKAAIFSHYDDDPIKFPYVTTEKEYKYCISYNEITKNLVGTKDDYTI